MLQKRGLARFLIFFFQEKMHCVLKYDLRTARVRLEQLKKNKVAEKNAPNSVFGFPLPCVLELSAAVFCADTCESQLAFLHYQLQAAVLAEDYTEAAVLRSQVELSSLNDERMLIQVY
jgi:hypothetical protein